jgi:hypothetical protein
MRPEPPLNCGGGAAGVLAHLSQVVRLLTMRTGGGKAPEYHHTVAEAVTAARTAPAAQPTEEGFGGQAIGVVRF